MEDKMTIMATRSARAKATKKFKALKDGNIQKIPFSAGKFFDYEEVSITNIHDVYNVLKSLLHEPEKFIIRGKPKKDANKTVYRRMYGDGAAFDAQARYWLTLDLDKIELPSHLDPAFDPVAVIAWVLALLPDIFQDVTCVYKFSSSQNIPTKIGDKPPSNVSVHLTFYCDTAVTEAEWKRFFKANPSPIDEALFSAVQIHYSAAPIIEGFDDPMPERIGLFESASDLVCVPEIPEAQPAKSTERPDKAPKIKQEDQDKAIELLLPYYEEQSRNRLCGALAGALYRGGWEAENAADFVWQLAEEDNDNEAMSRHDCALRICEAVDNDQPAQGIPTLRDEFEIERLDEILKLIGIDKPDIEHMISKLSKTSTPDDYKVILQLLLYTSITEKEIYLEQIKAKTGTGKGTLNNMLKALEGEARASRGSDDSSLNIVNLMLGEYFGNGRHLMRCTDSNFWCYNSRYWEPMLEDHLTKILIPYASAHKEESETVAGIVGAALRLLKGRVFSEGDPLRFTSEPLPVFNCRNGELHYDDKGNTTLKPHCPESYLRQCIDVAYVPEATCPKFKAALLEIFNKSSDSEDMYRHMMEIIGYLCQTWRRLAIILMLHGSGSNGKTSMMSIVEYLVGSNAIMADRISEIEKNIFKVGALDGKLMLIDEDVDEGTCLPDGFLKKISEQKTMSGQHKYKDSFQFVCRALPVLLANSYPSIKDLSYGIQRRMMIVPFNRKFEKHEMVLGLFEKIWGEEASGILNEAVAGFQRLRKRGQFDEPKDCLRAKNEWLVRSNILVTFVEEYCQKDGDKTQGINEFYEVFKTYCEDAGVFHRLTRGSVKNRIESMGYEIGSLNGRTIIRGLYAPAWGEAINLDDVNNDPE